MERRYEPRAQISSSVLIFHKKVGCIKGFVKNFSLHGMLVDIEQSTLPKGSIVELAGPVSWKFKSRSGLPKGLIVHSKDGKAGLMLTAESGEITEVSGVSSTTGQKKYSIQEAV